MRTDTVTTGNIVMDYFSFGEGEKPFVILPGVDTKSILLSAAAVKAAYGMFAEEYTVYVFDRRRNMPEDCSVMQMADDTAAVMTALGLTGADIFGASQGGMIAMCIAIRHPQLVHALVLGSTAARADAGIESQMGEWLRLAEARDMPTLTANFIDNLYSADTVGRYRDFLLHMNDNVSDEDIRRFIIQARAIVGFDITGELCRITCPALVIGSQGDRLLPAGYSKEIADALGCELYLYGPEYGHCVFDEAPDYKQRILEFFRRQI